MTDTNWLDVLWGLANTFSPSEAEAKVVAADPQAQALIDAVRTGATLPEKQETDPMLGGRFDPVRKNIYRNVLQAAEARPETVTVGTHQGELPNTEHAAGAYYPENNWIYLRRYGPQWPQALRGTGTTLEPTAVNYQDVLSHELVHFLLTKLAPELIAKPPSTLPRYMRVLAPGETGTPLWNRVVQTEIGFGEQQHDFIEYLQGLAHMPISKGLKAGDMPDIAAYATKTPLTTLPGSATENTRDVYTEVLRRIIQNPTLLQRALHGLR